MPQREPETIRIGQLELKFLCDGADTLGRMDMFEMIVPPGARVPGSHYHVEADEAVYGLAGVLTYTIGGDVHEIRAGDHAFAPRGAVHHFVNNGTEPARVLSVLTPGTIGPKYFREMGELVNAAMASRQPPDMERVKEIMRKHGLVAAPLPK